jgi:hypothetical protein
LVRKKASVTVIFTLFLSNAIRIELEFEKTSPGSQDGFVHHAGPVFRRLCPEEFQYAEP